MVPLMQDVYTLIIFLIDQIHNHLNNSILSSGRLSAISNVSATKALSASRLLPSGRKKFYSYQENRQTGQLQSAYYHH